MTKQGKSWEALREAAIRTDQACGRLPSEAPDEVLAICEGLVRGWWSMIDWFDTDQRRYVLAIPNPSRLADLRAPTERASQVAVHAALGASHSATPEPTEALKHAIQRLQVVSMRVTLRHARLRAVVDTLVTNYDTACRLYLDTDVSETLTEGQHERPGTVDETLLKSGGTGQIERR